MKYQLTEKQISRFLSKLVIQNNGCIEWSGAVDRNGYGHFCLRINKKITWIKPHRLILDLNGYDINEKVVIHQCDNPRCCNVKHLSLGTQKENIHDAIRKGRAGYLSNPYFIGNTHQLLERLPNGCFTKNKKTNLVSH